MAIAPCEQCGCPSGPNVKPPGYAKKPYSPVAFPNSGIVCGKPSCENDALIWLKTDEEQRYKRGERVFMIHTQTARLQ